MEMKLFKKNESETDRAVRAVLGIALLAVYALNYAQAPWNYVAAALGAILLITAATGSCLIYSLLGIKTG